MVNVGWLSGVPSVIQLTMSLSAFVRNIQGIAILFLFICVRIYPLYTGDCVRVPRVTYHRLCVLCSTDLTDSRTPARSVAARSGSGGWLRALVKLCVLLLLLTAAYYCYQVSGDGGRGRICGEQTGGTGMCSGCYSRQPGGLW